VLPGPPGQQWFDVTSYGAVGDGVADDTTAIQSAVDAAGGKGPLVVPPGAYRFSAPLRVPNRTLLIGLGSSESTLIYTGPPGRAAVRVDGTSVTHNGDIVFQDLQITGSIGTGGGSLISLEWVDRAQFLRCALSQTGQSGSAGSVLHLSRVIGVQVIGCVIQSAAAFCVHHASSSGSDRDLQILDSHLSSTYRGAGNGLVTMWAPEGTSNVVVDGCDFGPMNGNGVSVQLAYVNVTLQGNSVHGCNRIGLEATNGPSHVVMLGNRVDMAGVVPVPKTCFGLSIGGARALCVGNRVQGVVGTSYGIELVGAEDGAVVANSVSNCDEGIVVNNSPRSAISGNSIDTSQYRGLFAYATAPGQSCDDCTIVGNIIRNSGAASTANGLAVAGIELNPGLGSCVGCNVVGNVVDGVGSPAGALYSYGINLSNGRHICQGNRLQRVSSELKIAGGGVAQVSGNLV
jgi:parallel beta-helix repeat protein